MARRKAITIRPTDRFIADLHFGHGNMLSQCGRPWASVDEMDVGMIEAWNFVVRKNDRVFVLGDFAWWRLRTDRLTEIFSQLNGEKHLAAVGNHDTDNITSLPWASVSWISHFKDPESGLKIAASHHPQREWDGWFKGAVHLHGHVHGNLPNSRRSLDVGVDSVGFYPLTFEQIMQKMDVLPELDFTGVPTVDFVPDKGQEDDAALPTP